MENPGEHATIILHDIGAEEMGSLLRFMYCGSASVPRRCLRAFLRAAHALQVSVLMPGMEQAISEEVYHCRGPIPRENEGSRSVIEPRPLVHDATLPRDLSTSGVKSEIEGVRSGREEDHDGRPLDGVPSPRPIEGPSSVYRGEETWNATFREGLLGHRTSPQRNNLSLPRPTPVVRSPWSQRNAVAQAPWRPPPVIGPVQPATPPPTASHMEPIMCQSSGMETLAVPTPITPMSSELRKPCCCPPSPFCPSPTSSSSAYSTASSWCSNTHPPSPSASSNPSPRPHTLTHAPTKNQHHAESPPEGRAALAAPSPVLRDLSPNPAPLPKRAALPVAPAPPSPPSSPSRYILKQRRLRDFYRSMQSATNSNAEDSQSGDGQTINPSRETEKEEEPSPVLPSPSPLPPSSPLRQWPSVEHSVIRLSPGSAFQPPQIIISPPDTIPLLPVPRASPPTEDRLQMQNTPGPVTLSASIQAPSGSCPVSPSAATTSVKLSGGAHTCETCGKTFGRRQLLEQHRRTHTGEKPFECTVCGKSFTQRGHWSVHQRLHDGSRPHVCPVCGKAFVSRASLKVHHRTHTGEKPFRCEDCGKQFSQLRNFKYHRSVHEGTKEFACTCPECGKQFNDRGYLSSHLKIHRNRKEYACEHCEKRFNQRVAYNMHVRIHTGEKPHACGECGKRFGRKMLLRQHARTHTGERPFRCAVCGKAFADRSNMALHARLHSGEKPHACTLCGKAFTKKHHLKTHMNFHTGVKPYACERCGLRFSQSSNMRTHAKKCTAEGEGREVAGPSARGVAVALEEGDSGGGVTADAMKTAGNLEEQSNGAT